MKKGQKNKNFFFDNFLKKNCRGIIPFYVIAILIAVAILAILMITIFLLRGQGISLVDKGKDLLRIG